MTCVGGGSPAPELAAAASVGAFDPQPESHRTSVRINVPEMRWTRLLSVMDHLLADRGVELGDGSQVGADQVPECLLRVAIGFLRVEEIEQRRAAMLVGKGNDVAHVGRLLQVPVAILDQQVAD